MIVGACSSNASQVSSDSSNPTTTTSIAEAAVTESSTTVVVDSLPLTDTNLPLLFAGVEGLEYVEELGLDDQVLPVNFRTIRSQGRPFVARTSGKNRDGYPIVLYAYKCSDTIAAQVLHWGPSPEDPNNPIYPLPAHGGTELNVRLHASGIPSDYLEEDGFYIDRDGVSSESAFNGDEVLAFHDLRGVEQAEGFLATESMKLENETVLGVSGWVYGGFQADGVEVLVNVVSGDTWPTHLETRTIDPSKHFEVTRETLWDQFSDPRVTDHFDCVAEAWNAVQQTILELADTA